MSERRVVAVGSDLFFAARIAANARTLGVMLDSLDTTRALEACRTAPPDLVILDLHAAGDPAVFARALKEDPATRGIPIVGYYSHVDRVLRDTALDAGVDLVLPRSAFTMKLPEILKNQ